MTRLSGPRLLPSGPDDWDEETRNLLAKGTGRAEDAYNVAKTISHHPKLMKRWTPLLNHCFIKSTLPGRDRELLILRIAWLTKSEYEWGQHIVMCLDYDCDQGDIDRIQAGPAAAGWSDHERHLLNAVSELLDETFLSDETWAGLGASYDNKQILDLIFTVGNYKMLAMALNSLGVQLDEGLKGFD